ncbi:MAG: polyprenyl diphosphate synthase [bacterium]|nr:polyprenyl diphosphate synthase [bacterium]
MPSKDQLSLPKGTKVPDHIAIILDGNRRWARARGLAPWEGHKAGFQTMKKTAQAARNWGVHTLTVWGFSTENWDRPSEEVAQIMKLVGRFLVEFEKEAKKDEVRLVHVGRKDRIDASLAKTIAEIERATRDYKKHVLNFAFDYGGRDEILRAVKRLMGDNIKPEDVDEKLFASYLDTGDQPYPYVDLFIRPSGEQRTSGLLPWQAAYAEYYWELDHLPDFSPEKLKAAILDYSRRRRRFGANDKEEHLKFNPKAVANLEIGWRHALALGEGERFRDLVVRYVREHYGLSKEYARDAGLSLARALLHGKAEDWDKAEKSLEGLYKILKKTLGLALEPKLVASLEVDLWRRNGRVEETNQGLKLEEGLRKLYAETFRFSDLQATKTAHLAALATAERDQAEKKSGDAAKWHWERTRWYLERFYAALKDRVA